MGEADAPTRMRRLFALSGVVPLGAFLVLHLWTSAALLSSREIYDRQVSFLHGGPLLALLEVAFVLLPLGFHAGYGLWLATNPQQRRAKGHGYESELMRALERVTGMLVLVFVVAHVWDTRGPTWTGGLQVASYSTRLVERLSTLTWGLPLIALGYLLGIAATVFHLVNGVSSLLRTSSAMTAATPATQRTLHLVVRAGGVLLFVVASATVLQLATGTRFVPAEDRSTAGVCGPDAEPPPAARPARSALPALPAPSALPSAAP